MHVCEALEYIGDAFNDVTSSFIILEGNWRFYRDANFQNQMMDPFNELNIPATQGILGPGVYNWIEDRNALGPNTNDQLSSLKPDIIP